MYYYNIVDLTMSSTTSHSTLPVSASPTIISAMDSYQQPTCNRLHAPSVEQSAQILCFDDHLIRYGEMYGPARWPGIRTWDKVPVGINWPNA